MRLYWAIAAILVAAAFGQVTNRKQARPSRRRESGTRQEGRAIRPRVEDDRSKKVVCYYTNWSVYRKGLAKYGPQNINPYLCTHLIYAFGGLTDEFTIKPFDSYQDIEQGGYAKFNGLKQYNKNLKTLLAIGGWNEGSGRFSELVELPENRKIFVQSAIKHLRRYNFDGLDLDWEYPASRTGSVPEDRENYAALVKELRDAFNQEGRKIKKGRLLLTMAVPAGQNYIDKGYDIPSLTRDLDFFNILNYDYHSAYEPEVNHHAAIMPPPGTSEHEPNAQLTVDWTIRYYLSLGADAHKLVMGIPSYGRSFTLQDGIFSDLGSVAGGPGEEGKYTKEKGYLAFYEVCELIASDGWEVAKPFPRRIGPYAYKGNQWVGYDDEHIVTKKAEYVREHNLGGIMFWSLDSEDFRGICNGQEYPLIEAGKKALFAESETSLNEAQPGNSLIRPVATPTTTSRPSRRPRPGTRKQAHQQSAAQTTYSPLNTPAPPTTPSPASGFKCRREGFFPNEADCHKYHWCLDSGASGLGIVAHLFTCPSDLVFNKAIDGCDHPSSTKCKQSEPNRGGAGGNVQATSTPFPRTTSIIPNYDYEQYYDEQYYDDTYYDDYYYEDYYDQSPVKDTSSAADATVPSRNSGGSQFGNANEAATDTKSSTGNRNTRPQYTSLTRDRPQAAEGVEAVPEVESEQSNAPGRPKYTNIQRQRPTVNESPIEEETATSASQPGRRTYSSIDRRRPTTEAPAEVETGTTQSSGREYVTLSRNRAQGAEENIQTTAEESTTEVSVTVKQENSGLTFQESITESPVTEEPKVVRIRTRPPPTPTRPRPTPPPTVSKPRPTRPRPTRPRPTRPPTTSSTTTTSTTTTTTTTISPLPEVDTLGPETPLEDESLYEDYYVDEFIPETTAQPEVSVRPTIRSLISRTKSPVTESSPKISATRATPKPRVSVRPRPSPRPRPSLGSRTTAITATPRPRPPPRSPRPPRTTTPRPQSPDYEFDYDYYYDTLEGALGGTLGQLAVVQDKAILQADGSVICYDTGYFSHPNSCKKFISCSKTVRGVVRGWVYSCPDRLVFDPVGGMCNWAEAVDCVAR